MAKELLGVWPSFQYPACIKSSTPHNHPRYFSGFVGGEMEAHRGWIICPREPAPKWQSQYSNTNSSQGMCPWSQYDG